MVIFLYIYNFMTGPNLNKYSGETLGIEGRDAEKVWRATFLPHATLQYHKLQEAKIKSQEV